MRLRALLIFGLGLGGCTFTSFQNRVRFELDPSRTDKAELFSVVNDIAKQNGLTPDKAENAPGTRVGFFGKPYHYYLFEVTTSTEGPVIAQFTHEARMSSTKVFRSEPEKALLEAVKTKMKEALLKVEHDFKH